MTESAILQINSLKRELSVKTDFTNWLILQTNLFFTKKLSAKSIKITEIPDIRAEIQLIDITIPFYPLDDSKKQSEKFYFILMAETEINLKYTRLKSLSSNNILEFSSIYINVTENSKLRLTLYFVSFTTSFIQDFSKNIKKLNNFEIEFCPLANYTFDIKEFSVQNSLTTAQLFKMDGEIGLVQCLNLKKVTSISLDKLNTFSRASYCINFQNLKYFACTVFFKPIMENETHIFKGLFVMFDKTYKYAILMKDCIKFVNSLNNTDPFFKKLSYEKCTLEQSDKQNEITLFDSKLNITCSFLIPDDKMNFKNNLIYMIKFFQKFRDHAKNPKYDIIYRDIIKEIMIQKGNIFDKIKEALSY